MYTNCLEESIYGHKDAKMQILQIISKWITNPKSKKCDSFMWSNG